MIKTKFNPKINAYVLFGDTETQCITFMRRIRQAHQMILKIPFVTIQQLFPQQLQLNRHRN